MVTAYDNTEGQRTGAREFLIKPVDFDHLKAQLQGLPNAANVAVANPARLILGLQADGKARS